MLILLRRFWLSYVYRPGRARISSPGRVAAVPGGVEALALSERLCPCPVIISVHLHAFIYLFFTPQLIMFYSCWFFSTSSSMTGCSVDSFHPVSLKFTVELCEVVSV